MKQANNLLRQTKQSVPPVNLHEVAMVMGVAVRKCEFDGKFTSVVITTDQGEKVVAVNERLCESSQRMSIAQAMARFALRQPKAMYVRPVNKLSDLDCVLEAKANVFAAALLMPAAWIESAVNEIPPSQTGESGIEILARNFKVSTAAMMHRLVELGILRTI